jgi:DNA repair exonuclease SbcCD ATPase subunit
MVSQISELSAKLEESETALTEAKASLAEAKASLAEAKASLAEAKASANATIGALTATIDGFEAKILMYAGLSSEEATCPVCSKTFFQGGFHPASQKLWQHMGDGKMHRKTRQKMLWNKTGWNGPRYLG